MKTIEELGGAIRKAAHILKCSLEGYEIDSEYWLKQEKSYNDFITQRKQQTTLF